MKKVLRAGEIFVVAIASHCLVFSAIVKVVRDVLELTTLGACVSYHIVRSLSFLELISSIRG
jgi:hypothetical protein